MPEKSASSHAFPLKIVSVYDSLIGKSICFDRYPQEYAQLERRRDTPVVF